VAVTAYLSVKKPKLWGGKDTSYYKYWMRPLLLYLYTSNQDSLFIQSLNQSQSVVLNARKGDHTAKVYV